MKVDRARALRARFAPHYPMGFAQETKRITAGCRMVTLKDIAEKEDAVSLIGLGYVGLPIAVEFAKVATVIGFDSNAEKIATYKEGKDPTREVGDVVVGKTTVQFTSQETDLRKARFHIVAVPTPVSKDHLPDLAPVCSASRTLGRNLTAGSIVVYESTVYPGVTEDVCVPILERESGLVCGRDFFVGYSPERINPGDKQHRLRNIVKVVSGMSPETLETVAGVYKLVVDAGVYRAPSIKVAEAAKVIENSQRDINIAFVNELAMIFDAIGVDTHEVLKAAGTKWNFLNFKPGLVGGHCIGVDPYYLTYCAQQAGYPSQVILSGRRINDGMGKYVAERLIKLLLKAKVDVGKAKVVIMGLTFKENCPDTRNTRVIDIYRELGEYGVTPSIYDPEADKDEVFAEYGVRLAGEESLAGDADAVVLAVAHDAFEKMDPYAMLNKSGVLMDVKGVLAPREGYLYWRL